MKTLDLAGPLVGLHRFIAYEGDVEYGTDERTGLLVPLNPVLFDKTFKNTIVTSGKTAYLQRLGGTNATAAFTSLGVGTDSTAAAVGQTQLNPTVAGSVLLQAADATYPSVAGTVLTIQSTFATGSANFQWNEAGYFNGTTNGTSVMFNRVVIGPFTKTAAVSIVYVSTITQS